MNLGLWDLAWSLCLLGSAWCLGQPGGQGTECQYEGLVYRRLYLQGLAWCWSCLGTSVLKIWSGGWVYWGLVLWKAGDVKDPEKPSRRLVPWSHPGSGAGFEAEFLGTNLILERVSC